MNRSLRLSWMCDAVQLRGHHRPRTKTEGTLSTAADVAAFDSLIHILCLTVPHLYEGVKTKDAD